MQTDAVTDIDTLRHGFEQTGYVTDRALATVVYLLTRLRRPLLIEGQAGVGKTEVAKVLAACLGTELIRLQCYEGLDVSSALYEWNYQKQLLTIKLHEGTDRPVEDKERHIFGPDFLLPRPLLQSITAQHQAPVLLIDEIDRADEEFEAFLLELLSDFQISIPEMGTVKATHIPYVILTSNRTRELSDALKRRCLYHWIEYPSLGKELTIVHNKVPHLEQELAAQVVSFIQTVRHMQMAKPPGVAETLDWATALLALGTRKLDAPVVEDTLGCVLKSTEDMARLKTEGIGTMLQQLAQV